MVTEKRSRQLVGAFGERAVEAELLRRGWLTANINASIKNAQDFDLFAHKDGQTQHIRVKACSPGEDVQFRTPASQEIVVERIGESDFTIIVRMGLSRDEDQFYIVPTGIVLQALAAHRTASLAGNQQDKGHWVLRWREHGTGLSKPNYGFEKKWLKYRDAWEQLAPTA
jgi:hypothetical protein